MPDKTQRASERPTCPFCGAGGLDEKGDLLIYSKKNQWICSVCGKHLDKDLPANIDNFDLSRYVHEPRLEGDFLVIFDTHFPFQHPQAFQHAKKISEKWGIKKCLIPGDGIDLDAFKKFLDRHPDISGWADEKERVREGLLWLASWMNEVHLLVGNHELRMWKRIEGKGEQDDIYEMILSAFNDDAKSKFHYYLYPCAIINNSWIVDHPNMSSVIPGRVPFRMSSKYMVQHLIQLIKDGIQPLNGQYGYISGHGHLGGESTDESGEIQVADGMVMCDPNLFSYYKLKRNARPAWRIGFNIIKNNYLYRFPEDNTDWGFWLS